MAKRRVKTVKNKRQSRQASNATPIEKKVHWGHADAVRLAKTFAEGKTRPQAIQDVATALGITRSLSEEMLRGDHHVRPHGEKRQSVPLLVVEDIAVRARDLTPTKAKTKRSHKKAAPPAEPTAEELAKHNAEVTEAVHTVAERLSGTAEPGPSGEAEESDLEGKVESAGVQGVA